jgi:hypothetical protein
VVNGVPAPHASATRAAVEGRLALLSVLRETRRVPDGVPDARLPRWLRPIPFAEAVKILSEHPDPEVHASPPAHAARRGAAATLWADGLQDHVPGVGGLVGRLADDLGRSPVRMRAELDRAVGGAEATRAGRLSAAMKLLAPGSGDEAKIVEIKTEFDVASLVTTVTGAAEVKRPPEQLAKLVDPRRWSEASPEFAASYAVEQDAQGAPRYQDGRPKAAPPSGSPTFEGLLFEDVVTPVNRTTFSRYRNLLSIDLASKDGGLNADFSLYDSLSSQILVVEMPGGVDVDFGHVSAKPLSKGWTRYEVVKHLRYSDLTPRDASPEGPWDYGQTLNYLAPALLSSWIEEGLFSLLRMVEDGQL